jgi:branched-chain amino acid transport system permease protein
MSALTGVFKGQGIPKNANRALAATVIMLAVLFPLFLAQGSGWVDDMTLALAYVVMALGLNVVVGYAGLLDLGYVAFFAFGAYATGWFMSGFYDADVHVVVSTFTQSLPGIHLNFVLVVFIAMGICALAGIIIGLPTLRLRGDYIAIVTLAFGEIIRVFAINGDDIHLPFVNNATLTAGRQGITPVDKVYIPGLPDFTSLDLRPWYYTALVMVLIVLFINIRLRDSRMGRAWIALREDEVAASSMGVPLVKTKLMAYAVGASFGGASGAFFGSYLNTVNADQFQFGFSIFILAMVILGGLGSVWGVVVGAVALELINNRLIPDVLNDLPSKFGLNFNLVDVNYGIFGFLLVLMMVLRPQGLIPERRRKIELTEGIGSGTEADMVEVSHA